MLYQAHINRRYILRLFQFFQLIAAGGSSISGPTEDTKIGGEDEYTTLCNLKEDLSGR